MYRSVTNYVLNCLWGGHKAVHRDIEYIHRYMYLGCSRREKVPFSYWWPFQRVCSCVVLKQWVSNNGYPLLFSP